MLGGGGGLAPRRLLSRCTPGRRPRQVTCAKLCGRWRAQPIHLYGTVVPPDEITVHYRHGLPLITLTLPSRRERCQFVIKPLLSTVGSFLQDIHSEDKGVKDVAIFTTDGHQIPASTSMATVLLNDFRLIMDQVSYDVCCPQRASVSGDPAEMEALKSLVHQLYVGLHLDELRHRRERHLVERLGHLARQLLPLEQTKARIEEHSEAAVNRYLWGGLALLSVQGGALAWFTWWVYSWDVMEPVTYFLGIANSMVFFAYFITTRQTYTYTAFKSRQFLHFFHKISKTQNFDVAQYNQLKEEFTKTKDALSHLRHSQHMQKYQP